MEVAKDHSKDIMANGVASEPIVQIHKKALRLLAVPVTVGVLAAVVGAVGSLYAWADTKTAATWSAEFEAEKAINRKALEDAKQDLVDHKANTETKIQSLAEQVRINSDTTARVENKMDRLLIYSRIGFGADAPPRAEALKDAGR